MSFIYRNKKGLDYYLNSKEIVLKGSNKNQRIFYFSKDKRAETLDEIPDGYETVENPKTGLPVIRKIR